MIHATDQLCLKTIHHIANRRKLNIFLVGGFLRDVLLKRESRDLDFAVERKALSFAKRFSQEIKGAFIVLDDQRGCARVAKKRDGKLYTFDFADFRAPTLKSDLLLRDFTVNTLALDVSIDPSRFPSGIFGSRQAMADIKSKRIRMVSEKVFQDDPLRLLRAFALKAGLGFVIDKATLSRIKKEAALIRAVSAERIREELFKILESSKTSVTFRQMDRAGLLEYVIPQVRVMFGVTQGSTYHHLDVWKHSLETIKQAELVLKELERDKEIACYFDQEIAGNHSRRALLKLACLLHDVGKPETRRREGERLRFHGHENVGRSICRAVAKHIKLSTKERHILCDLVQMHLRPGFLSNVKRPSERSLFRYFRDTKDEAVSIAVLAMADQRATRGPMTMSADIKHHDDICRMLIKRYFDMKRREPFVPLITGKDLISILRLKPSPIFSKILREVEEAQVTGKVTSVKEALELAKVVIHKG